MAEAKTLTLAFVSSHPADAARVLEALPAVDAAALFASLPARAVAPALTAMASPVAARIVLALDDTEALRLLSAAGVQGAVGILRHVAEPRRTRLIEGLSTAAALASRLLLGYPEDTVGAWADPETISLAPGATAAEALARVRSETDLDGGEIYVVGKDQLLLGLVDLQVLLRVPDTTLLSALMRTPAGTLPAIMALSGAAAHQGWKQASVLPVVESGKRLVGVLHAEKLAQALSRGARRPETSDETLAGMVARSYWDTVSGLLGAGLNILPPVKRVLPEEP
jgi:magnesium transporter